MVTRKLNNPLLYNYQYDQLDRLIHMDAWNRTSTPWSAITKVPDFQESIAYDPNGNIQQYKRNGNNTFAGQPIGMDSLNYFYTAGTNKLDHITDSVPSTNYTTDIDGQAAGNYQYDSIGELVSDAASGITNITWTVYGKIASITKGGDTTLLFTYDPGGNRISKSVIHAGDTLTTWYARDAQGNVLSVYTYGDPSVRGKDLTQTELHIYGSSRLGIWKMNTDVEHLANPDTATVPLLGMGDSLIFTRGNKLFELTNHLGNVLATISDKRYGVSADDSTVGYFIPEMVSANDYYPFGSLEPGRSYTESGVGGYRYGFNGKEKDDEVKGVGDEIDYGFRVYDPRIGKFLSVDPLVKSFPWWTPYQFAGNTPIQAMDQDGKEIYFYVWDQNKQDNTTLRKVSQIDIIEQKSDIIFLTDLFGWRITQKANLKDLGLEQTWILYDNNWRLVPNSKLNESLGKITKEEWGSFLTPDKVQQTLDNIKDVGDKAGLAVNLILLADGLRDLYKSVKAVSKILTKSERLEIFQSQLANAKPASNQEEAIRLINNTLDKVEDTYSGVPKSEGIPNRDDGRMYGILDDKYITTLEDGTKVARTKGNRIILKQDGGFEIQTKDGSKTLFSKPGAPKK